MSTEEEVEVPLVPRSAEEVAKRALALFVIVDKVHNANPAELNEWVKIHGVREFLSAAEMSFFDNATPDASDRAKFSWRTEALVTLVWALGHVNEFPPLNKLIDWSGNPVIHSMFRQPALFVSEARLRPIEEIKALEGELYHQHWRVRDARLFDRPMPTELDPEIVYERRYAASWITGWGDNWDEVPTDT